MRVKLIKCIIGEKHPCFDYYDNTINMLIAEGVTAWEEVTDEEYYKLEAFVRNYDNKKGYSYMLVREQDVAFLKETISQIIAKEAAETAKREQERTKQEKKMLAEKAKRAEKIRLRELKKFEELKKKFEP
jgi:vacuolar-type H+-ATPase subunit F/Vma7